MNTRTICISASMLYDSPNVHRVRDTTTGVDYLLTKWGSFRVTSMDNHFVIGERVKTTGVLVRDAGVEVSHD